jgi:uncharacterized protein (DUF983 family)
MAFCPNCKKDVVFIEAGSTQRCSVCGSEFQLSQASSVEPHWAETAAMTIGHVLVRVVLIIGVVFLVGMAVLFASCALHL